MAVAVFAALWKSPLTHIMLGLIFLAGHTLVSAVIAEGALSPVNPEPDSTTTECEWYNQTLCAQSSNTEGCGGIQSCEKWPESPEKKNHCFVVWTNNTEGKVEVTFKGCWMPDPQNCVDKTDCVNTEPVHKKEHIFCCCNGNNCNHNFSWQPSEEKPTTTPPSPVVSGDTVFNTVAWTLGTFFAVAVVITPLFYIYRRRKMGNFVELAVESTPLAPPSPALCQRSIQLLEIKARGRFGAVWKATLPPDIVAVKIFPVQDKQSWVVEKEVYSLPQMGHDNILAFIGAERRGDSLNSEFWLITSYHEWGSLCDYLKANIVTWADMCRIGETMARGLMYLHEEVSATKMEAIKPSIAHRDFKSKNVLLKADLTACIADFGLALVFHPGDPTGDTHGQVGTRRYMAPEVLEGAINFQRDAFLRIDMYACGLVLWEVLSRCTAQDGPVGEYHLPFEDEVGQHPTLDDMQECVVTNKTRPAMRDTWRKHPGLIALIDTMEECWDHDAEARLSASCVVERLAQNSRLLPHPPTSHLRTDSTI